MERRCKAQMRRIVLDIQSGMFAEAMERSLEGSIPDFMIYRSPKPEDTAALCRSCQANVLVMEVRGRNGFGLCKRQQIRNEVKKNNSNCKILLLVDENEDVLLAADVRQAVKDRLADNFIYASVSPSYLAAVIDTL